MLTEERVLEALKEVQDPDLHKSITETGGVKELKIKEGLVSLKVGLARTGTPQQMQLQQRIVAIIKGLGVESVGLRFTELTEAEIAQHAPSEQAEQGVQLLGPDSKTEFIAVTSGKGGVGKSTVSVNLAITLARLGKKVAIIDADIYGFSVPDMMGIEERPKVKADRIYPVERHGVKVMSMGFFVEDNAPIIWRGPMLGKMLKQFFDDVEWGNIDYLILDLPPGTGDVALDIHTMLPQSKEIIVTTPHATAAFVAARAGAMAIRTNHQILGVVENMAYFESKLTGEKEYVFGQGGGDRLAEELKTEILGRIPLGQPEIDPNDFAPSVYPSEHPIGQIYKEIGLRIITKTEK